MQLDRLHIIVTGGSSGMGRHFVLRLAEAGAHVATGDVDEQGLVEVAKATENYAGNGCSTYRMRTLSRGLSTGRTTRWVVSTD